RTGGAVRIGELFDDAGGRNLADLVRARFGKPEIAVRARADRDRRAVRRWGREFGDDAGGRDPADLVARRLGEPEIAVRAHGDGHRLAVRGRNGEFGDGPAGG